MIRSDHVHPIVHTGFMYFPPSWNENEETFADLGPNQGDHGLNYPLPDVYCDETHNLRCASAIIKGKKIEL